MPKKGIPTIKWGTFLDNKKISHIAPVIEGEDNKLMKGHKLDWTCPCSPLPKRLYNGGPIIAFYHYIIH